VIAGGAAGLTHAVIAHAQAIDIAARVVLAAANPSATNTANTTDDTDDESKKSGPIGLVVIIVLCVACYFLFKSMSKHLRQVREGSVPISAPRTGARSAGAPSTEQPNSAADASTASTASTASIEEQPAPPP
jgi:hypothetical protein